MELSSKASRELLEERCIKGMKAVRSGETCIWRY